MIYFVERLDTGNIKIGTSKQLSQRLDRLSRQINATLKVLAVCDGNLTEERALHEKFSHLNVGGEWFTPGADLLTFIEEECQTWNGIDDTPKSNVVKVESMLAIKAQTVAKLKGISTCQYISDMIRDRVRQDFDQVMDSLEEGRD